MSVEDLFRQISSGGSASGKGEKEKIFIYPLAIRSGLWYNVRRSAGQGVPQGNQQGQRQRKDEEDDSENRKERRCGAA